ncbi:DoxX family membrane protein [Nocardia terpenica]|uniref:DoxX family membrane protein n=1 Tax=Nocardia terpenica TaxID=455432 RepID=A0A6G9Z1B4_9NOCA|nr:DoxX family membrane protein [Nocardia terpenica]QIS19244.1 DoxX family membrane protein [Nocardia terpenica]
MSVVVLIGRILFAALFLGSAFGHLTQADAMAGYAQSKGVPAAKVAVLGSGVLLLLGGLSVLLGVWADLGSLLLLIFLVPTAVLMHPYWNETDPQVKQGEMVNFNKDIGLAGAALMLFAFFAHTCDLGLTVTGPLFHLG